VFSVVGDRIRDAVRRVMGTVTAGMREAFRPAPLAAGFARDLFRTREQLMVENAMLRQQFTVASRRVKRPAFRPLERGFLVALSSRLSYWRNVVLLVKPSTILRWHREGFRLVWRRRSRPRKGAEARISHQTIELIRRMAIENKTWGAERIRGELLKLGIRVSKRTIQRHVRGVRPPGDGQGWRTFLRNHTVWACDFLQVHDLWFRPLFAFFIAPANTKEVIHVGVTRAPNESWTAQQLREVTPFGRGPQLIIRDHDNEFGASFDRVAEGAGIGVVKTAIRAPLMNAVCERFIGSVRRECLDHVIVLGENHLRGMLDEYVAYFNRSRPHQGLEQRVPLSSTPHHGPTAPNIVARSVRGGLHHDYRWAA
jgi:transposase InsO family protein